MFHGYASDGLVFHDALPLRLERSLKVYTHSPSGFSWGYGGSGPAQLALAILLEMTDDATFARRWHQDFKRDVIACLPMQQDFVLHDADIADWIARYVD